MSVLVILIILGLLLAIGFLFAFVWAVKSGQFDDTYTPSLRILADGEDSVPEKPDVMTETRKR